MQNIAPGSSGLPRLGCRIGRSSMTVTKMNKNGSANASRVAVTFCVVFSVFSFVTGLVSVIVIPRNICNVKEGSSYPQVCRNIFDSLC